MENLEVNKQLLELFGASTEEELIEMIENGALDQNLMKELIEICNYVVRKENENVDVYSTNV